MKTDIEIAQEAVMQPIKEVAAAYGIGEDDLELYGKYKAKLTDELWEQVKDRPNGKLVLDQNQEPLKLEVTDVEKLQQEMEEGYEDDTVEDDTDTEDEDAPRVSVYTFDNPSRLISKGDNEYVPQDADAQAVLKKSASLEKGALETSGTDMAREMTRVIECQRAFSYALKMVTTSDEIESTINSLRG